MKNMEMGGGGIPQRQQIPPGTRADNALIRKGIKEGFRPPSPLEQIDANIASLEQEAAAGTIVDEDRKKLEELKVKRVTLIPKH